MKHRSFAKVNIFLKITGSDGDYHTISSRFMRVDSLFDEIWFESKNTPEFEIVGDFDCDTASNTIYRAYKQLQSYTNSDRLSAFFETHRVCVNKNIPSFAGLGGGSSNAATFLHMCNEAAELDLDIETLAEIGSSVGSDVAFFIYGYKSANVNGTGDIVEKFDEKPLDLELFHSDIKISTPAIYSRYRANHYNPISEAKAKELESMSSLEILEKLSPIDANDLYPVALELYENLTQKDGWFFTGSGSTFFRINNG